MAGKPIRPIRGQVFTTARRAEILAHVQRLLAMPTVTRIRWSMIVQTEKGSTIKVASIDECSKCGALESDNYPRGRTGYDVGVHCRGVRPR
jgi:hypothetical protein